MKLRDETKPQRSLNDLFNLDVFAVGREVNLDDEAGDVLTVTNPIERWSQRKVVEIHSTLN